ncbi:MAG: hypothetical protein ACEPOW_14080 [Bacteroidales bacterium]
MNKKFYRGDRRGNETQPEMHYSSGLITKLIQGGNPKYINQNGLLKTICMHIHQEDEIEKSFYRKSHYLSISESIDVAKFYLAGGKDDELVLTPKYLESKYLFIFDFNDENVTQISDYIYRIEYRCNRNLIEGHSPDTLAFSLLQNEPCQFCNKENYHSLLLINVVDLLKSNIHYEKSENALLNAQRDKEWLLLPTDYYSKLYGFSAIIPRADFWSANIYRLKTERERVLEETFTGTWIY